MKCKKCKRDIPDNSVFCNWCGQRQIAESNDISVPKPQRLKSGEYTERIMIDGQRYKIKAPTEREYYQQAKALKAGLIEKKQTPTNCTLDDILKHYININEPVFSVSTVRGYETNRRQLQQFGSYTAISNINWQDLINRLTAKYAPKTVKNIWGLIASALQSKEITPPTVNLPGAVKAERNYLEPEQIKLFLLAVKDRHIELTALLALHSLRESEILALTKGSISNGVIHVRGAVVPNKHNEYVRQEANKTYASARDVPVMIPRLLELWAQIETEPYIPHPSNIRRDLLRAAERADLPPITCHNLRHSFCSLAWYLQWDIKTTCALGGWSSPAVPTAIYAHLSSIKRNADVQSMTAFFESFPDNSPQAYKHIAPQGL